MYKNKKQKLIFGIVAMMLVVPFLQVVFVNDDANGISAICQKSAACREAAAKEAEANKHAAEAASSANMYQAKVNELSADIASKQAEIAETEAEIKALKAEIIEMEKKLSDDQDALAELLVNIHFESDAEPIRILAGASSISDLAEKAAREEVVKEQISVSAQKVKETKAQLEEDKAEIEELLATQQEKKQELVASRAEQQSLVDKYENDAEGYEQQAKEAQAAQRKAEKEYQETHQQYYYGSAYSGANTYPWQGDCPSRQDAYLTYVQDSSGWHKIGGYVCECVSYAGWKAYEAYGVAVGWGNAYSWDDGARRAGYRVDRVPEAGSIGQMDGYPYGHVFWVESVNGDGSINVTEYNNSYATYLYSGSSHMGDFGARVISAGEVGRYNYIHF